MIKHIVCHIIFWIITSGKIDFDIRYPYMYSFDISCNICIESLSIELSTIGIKTMSHASTSVYRYYYQCWGKWLNQFWKFVLSVVNHPDNLIPFWRVTVILFLPRNGNNCSTYKCHFLIVLEEGGKFCGIISVICFHSALVTFVANNGIILIL